MNWRTVVIQTESYCILRAAAMHLCWRDPDCIRLKNFPPSTLHLCKDLKVICKFIDVSYPTDIKFSVILVVLAVELSQPIGLQPTRHHEEMMEVIWIEVMNLSTG